MADMSPETPTQSEPKGMNTSGVIVLLLAVVAFVLGIIAKGM